MNIASSLKLLIYRHICLFTPEKNNLNQQYFQINVYQIKIGVKSRVCESETNKTEIRIKLRVWEFKLNIILFKLESEQNQNLNLIESNWKQT